MSRRKERPKCLVCNVEVNKANAKFCSTTCCGNYYAVSRRKDKPLCKECGKETNRNNSIFCNNKCSNDSRYNQYIQDWLDGKEDGVRGGIATSRRIHRYIIKRDGEKCLICGWKEINPFTGKVPVRLDHIDGNWQRNRPENLRLLCPNCDSLTSTYCALNKGKGRPYHIRKKIIG